MFLGFILNSSRMTLELPEKKRQLILSLIKKLKLYSLVPFENLLNITAACPAVKYDWLYSKGFERQKYLALLESGRNYDAKMKPSVTLSSDFIWWESQIPDTINPIKQQKYAREIFSDASLIGTLRAITKLHTG